MVLRDLKTGICFHAAFFKNQKSKAVAGCVEEDFFCVTPHRSYVQRREAGT